MYRILEKSHATPRVLATLAAALVIAMVVRSSPAAAQGSSRKVLTVDDYSRWRNINGSTISSDGKWVAYVLAFTNTATENAKPVLHIVRLDSNQDVEVQNASDPVFSADAKWLAYQIDPSGGRGGRGGRGGDATTDSTVPGGQTERAGASTPPAPPRRVELRNLETGAVQSWRDVQSFTFSATSSHLVLHRRPPTAAGSTGRGGAAADAPGGGSTSPEGSAGVGAETARPRGADVILHDLASGRDQLLGSVGDIAFNNTGELLAYTVDAAVRDGNGLFVLDLHNGRVNALDNDARAYNRLTWSEDGTSLAVLKGVEVEKMRERDNILLVYPNVRTALGEMTEYAPLKLDPAMTPDFPKGWVLSDRTPLVWSDDDHRVFFGAKEQVAGADTSRRRRNADDVADVDVWNTKDERIQSMQMIRADADRNFTYREAFELTGAKFVRLADSTMRDVEVGQDGRWAVGRDTRGYISDYKRPAADIYRVNTSTGERTLMLKDQLIGAHVFGIAPDGSSFLYWKDNKFQSYNLDSATTRTLGGSSNVSFVDAEYDHPGPRPSYGVNGYTSDGKAVVVAHRFDLWLLPLDGSAARNITNGLGTRNSIRFRYTPIEIDSGTSAPSGAPGGGRGGRGSARAVTIDLSKPVTLSAYGEYTKKDGFYELANGQLKELVYEDASFSNPTKAAKADIYLYTRQTFTEFPDLRVAGVDFKNSRKISNANPQQAEYLWGRRILFDFKDHDGHKLQGILAIPDDYKPGEKRPMLVNFYEKNSQNLNRYPTPSLLTGMGSSPIEAVTRGYLTMLPDVYFHTGSSHSDMLDCVEAATKKVIEMGYVDPKRIGINGHSYGGEGVAFIGTRSRLFAAVGMGAGVTDLYQDFSQNWGWGYQVPGGSGANGNDYYLYGQGRWGFSPWDKPDVYMFESALTHVRETTAPFLIMHGTADPTVAFQNGLGFYNALRFNGKNAILLAYTGEGHGLRGLANRRDLTMRYFQFFDHYLKGTPAPKWMTEGIPFLQKDAMRDPGVVP